jgi:phage-related protein
MPCRSNNATSLIEMKKIYEFRAGRLRVPFFKLESGKVVLCTHVFLKKTQKTSKTDVLKAVRWKKTYENAGEVEWME